MADYSILFLCEVVHFLILIILCVVDQPTVVGMFYLKTDSKIRGQAPAMAHILACFSSQNLALSILSLLYTELYHYTCLVFFIFYVIYLCYDYQAYQVLKRNRGKNGFPTTFTILRWLIIFLSVVLGSWHLWTCIRRW